MIRSGSAIAMALAFISSSGAYAADNTDLAEIRRQLELLTQRHLEDERRIQELEKRLERAEAATTQAATEAKQASAAVAAVPPPVAPASSANAFNPAISGVLDGKLGSFSKDPSTYDLAGFPLGGEGPGQRGLFLGEAEVNFQANIDDMFMGSLTLSLADDDGVTSANIEEAFIQTTSMPGGFQITAGKFLSDIGYLNSFHEHADDFADRPLAYRAFLANGIVDTGVRLTWLAPTDFYLRFGSEVMRGNAYPSFGAANNGFGAKTVYMRTGDDIGTEVSYQAGASWMWADAVNRDTNNGLDIFSGQSQVGIAHFVLKWAPNGNPVNRNLKFQAEVLRDHVDGLFNGVPVNRTDYGAYAQLIYQFKPQWRIGARYDWLEAGNIPVSLIGTTLDSGNHDPTRASAMLEYDHSEFSRIRLQYNLDRSRLFGTDREFILQYTATIGAHPAHSY